MRLSREWRQRFNLTESGLPPPDANWRLANGGLAAVEAKAGKPKEDQDLPAERVVAGLAKDLAHLPVDEVVRRLVPSRAAELARVADMLAGKITLMPAFTSADGPTWQPARGPTGSAPGRSRPTGPSYTMGTAPGTATGSSPATTIGDCPS